MKRLSVPRNVLLLAAVSFLTDISSEMTLTILPLFLANVLGVTTAAIGLIEGVAEATASLSKVFSGWLSDRVGRRKPLVVLGYTLSALSKPLLYFATTWGAVLGIRFADRLGKGIRTSPRDALIADSVASQQRGVSFGVHRAGDTAGALIGLALVALLVFLGQRGGLLLEREVYQQLVVVGVLPGLLAVVLLAGFVREGTPQRPTATLPSLRLRGFSPRFRAYLLVVALFTLGNSSDAFLLLRAQSLGLSVLDIALLLVAFNFVYTILATPAGALSDRWGRRGTLLVGWGLYGVVYLGLALAGASWQVWALFFLYGVYYGIAEGVGRAYVADLVAPQQRGTAYGLYHGVIGVMALPASMAAGILWQGLGPWQGLGAPAPFFVGALLAGLATFLLLVWVPTRSLGALAPEPTTTRG